MSGSGTGTAGGRPCGCTAPSRCARSTSSTARTATLSAQPALRMASISAGVAMPAPDWSRIHWRSSGVTDWEEAKL